MNAPTYSGSTTGVIKTSTTATRTTELAHEGFASQRLVVVDDPAVSGTWTVRHLAGVTGTGAPSPGSPGGNLPLNSVGSIGFWLNTTSAGVTAQFYMDDSPSGLEGSTAKSVIADGQWHLYEWQFDDAAQWNNVSGGNGTIDGAVVTIDSIVFKGSADATIYIDTVAHNPNGSLALIAGDFNVDSLVNDADLAIWETGFGAMKSGGALLDWQKNYAGSAAGVSAASGVPEPAAALLAAIGALFGARLRKRV